MGLATLDPRPQPVDYRTGLATAARSAALGSAAPALAATGLFAALRLAATGLTAAALFAAALFAATLLAALRLATAAGGGGAGRGGSAGRSSSARGSSGSASRGGSVATARGLGAAAIALAATIAVAARLAAAALLAALGLTTGNITTTRIAQVEQLEGLHVRHGRHVDQAGRQQGWEKCLSIHRYRLLVSEKAGLLSSLPSPDRWPRGFIVWFGGTLAVAWRRFQQINCWRQSGVSSLEATQPKKTGQFAYFSQSAIGGCDGCAEERGRELQSCRVAERQSETNRVRENKRAL